MSSALIFLLASYLRRHKNSFRDMQETHTHIPLLKAICSLATPNIQCRLLRIVRWAVGGITGVLSNLCYLVLFFFPVSLFFFLQGF